MRFVDTCLRTTTFLGFVYMKRWIFWTVFLILAAVAAFAILAPQYFPRPMPDPMPPAHGP